MTDIEIVRLCAEAMGFDIFPKADRIEVAYKPESILGMPPAPRNAYSFIVYSPLTDDAQAMALVKRFGLAVNNVSHENGTWEAVWFDRDSDNELREAAETVNRAICECVAQMMQQSKGGDDGAKHG